MITIGYVVVEYNQASKCPSLRYAGDLFGAEKATKAVGRGETYAVARVELVES